MDDCPRHFALVRHLAHELSQEEEQMLTEHLAHCAMCQREIQEITQDELEYHQTQPHAFSAIWAQVHPAPEEKSSPAKWPALLWKVGVPAVAAFAALVWGVSYLKEEPPTTVTYKGPMAVQIVAKRGTDQFPVDEKRRLCPNDALRFVITSSMRESHVAVLSIDRAGSVSIFYPNPATGSGQPIRLNREGRHELPGSIVLDQTTGAEHILVLSSPRGYDVRALAVRLRSFLRAKPLKALSAKAIGFAGQIQMIGILKDSCR